MLHWVSHAVFNFPSACATHICVHISVYCSGSNGNWEVLSEHVKNVINVQRLEEIVYGWSLKPCCLLRTDLCTIFPVLQAVRQGWYGERNLKVGNKQTTAPLRRSSLRQHKKPTGRPIDAYVDRTCCTGFHMQCLTFHQHAQPTHVSI